MESGQSGLEVEDEREVLLGLPGAWAVDSGEPCDHYTTKIGGCPDWPPSIQPSLLREEFLKCAVCGGLLGLVAQVHAPLSLHPRKQLSDRTLYIFGCPAPGCGLDPSCWRTVRVQKDHTVATDAAELTTGEPKDCASLETRTESRAAEPSSDWWEEDSSWGGETLDGRGSVAEHSDQFLNMSELAASLEEAGCLAAETAQEDFRRSKGKGVGRVPNGKGSTPRNSGARADSALPVFPCFYVYFQGEVTCQGKASASPPSSSPEESLQATTLHPSEESKDGGAEAWEGEEYEPDRALRVDRTYLRFRKHLDLNPEQCLRYCFGGEVIWAVEEDDGRVAPGECVGCGGPRVYELQLMPSLLFFLQQAMKNQSAPVCTLDDWDWFTLIVFSCAQSCSQKKAGESTLFVDDCKADWSIVEETTVLQQEATRICPSDFRC